ncbi:MAG: AIR synthase-related protein [Halofilum sp. (in: g-proteobacteria)]|nr:AIR synthase-related protein [Halofilum sp. (in: g-proteobacteria)]
MLSIHDVGAGGLSNAVPEILDDAAMGGDLELRAIPNDEPGMSPLAIWCNESQERYVLALRPERPAALRRDLHARALPLGRARRGHRRASPARRRPRARRHAGGPADGDAARQAAADAARRAPPRRRAGAIRYRAASSSPRPPGACCACRRWRARSSWSPSATAPSAAWWRATRWWARGRCRWPTAP